MDIGAVGEFIREHTQRSEILKWIYDHNYLAKGIEGFLRISQLSAFVNNFLQFFLLFFSAKIIHFC